MVDRLHYRVDRAGLTEPGSLHLFVVPADGGSARQITAGEWSTGVSYDGIRFSANSRVLSAQPVTILTALWWTTRSNHWCES